MASTALLGLVAGVIILLVVVTAAWLGVSYNRLVRLRTQVQASWAQIDVQLKRRQSLIPNLVETARGYAAHERAAFDAVATARANAISAQGPARQSQAEGELTQALGRLFAVAEAYPDLKANQNFLALQAELGETENRIAYARQFYNNAVQSLNTAVQTLPTNIVAGVSGFHEEPYFEATAPERADVQIQF
jgi:LemA protein